MVQTAQYMMGDARQLPSWEAIGGQDIIRRLAEQEHLLLMTQSTCIDDLIKSAGYRKAGKAE